MNIAIVSSKYLPSIGGLQTAVSNIVRQFMKKNHHVYIITNRYNRKLLPKEMIDGVMVRRFFFTDRPPRSTSVWIWLKYFIQLFLVPWSLARSVYILWKNRPDIVHLHYVGSPALYLIIAKKMLGFRLVVSIHGSDVDMVPQKSRYQQWLLKRTFNAADFITSNSQQLFEIAMEITGGSCSSRAEIVSMAFSPEEYNGEIIPYRHSHRYVFAAGRFTYIKGFDVLIAAFGIMIKNNEYDGDLIIAGEYENLDRYAQMAQNYGVAERIRFFGPASRQQMASLMCGCDLFIVPSRREAFGIGVLEALYAGKRVVGTAVSGIAELMETNRDQLVEPDNAGALARQIVESLSDSHWNPVNRDSIRQKYSWERVVESYLRIYRSFPEFGLKQD